MKENISKLYFETSNDFRTWLSNNAETSDGIWLVFGKVKKVITLTANDALEEALCFGWIDGQMKSIDSTRYLKYTFYGVYAAHIFGLYFHYGNTFVS